MIALLTLGIVFTVPSTAQADLRLHGDVAGLAPMDSVLRRIGPGIAAGGSIDYEIVDLLALGVYYTFSDFMSDNHDNVFDHAVGARLDLRIVRHNTAGWFGNTDGNAYGEAYIELDLSYHHVGSENRIGWGFGLGYRVIIAGPFGLGPFFRFVHVVAHDDAGETEGVDQFFASFGLELFLSFDLTGGGDDDQGEGDDEWDEFESVGDEEGGAPE